MKRVTTRVVLGTRHRPFTQTGIRRTCGSILPLADQRLLSLRLRSHATAATAPIAASNNPLLQFASTRFTRSRDEQDSDEETGKDDDHLTANPTHALLPVTCPGCGALSSDVDASEPGYYSRTRKAVKYWFRATKRQTVANDVQEETDNNEVGHSQPDSLPPPVCDRCHDLLHNVRGTSIAHPKIEDIADSIAESPFSRNHVYHVLDAADFPMSLIPSILSRLSLARPRTQNRRSKERFSARPTLSFIITRSDLLGPTKEKVDILLPYFRNTLRKALYQADQGMRLGNVHLVSAKRGWWTKEIKESIWERGGGNWMVGKFNVGKSNLFEVLFPKGSGERAPVYTQLAKQQSNQSEDLLLETSLLPPPQPEVPFPSLPVVSSLPGTTASPIRLPFGNQRGELIDMPGLERGDLEQHVRHEHKLDLVMMHRPKVEQHTIKPGQSLLLGGGLIRITPFLDPNDPSTTMLAYPFVPIDAHVTATEKAVAMQAQDRETGVKSILAEGAGATISSAGTMTLETDVTKHHAGAVVRAGQSLSQLPFQIYSTDLLIEGIGWVELACQVRRHRRRTSLSPIIPTKPVKHADTLETLETSQADGEAAFKPFTPHFGGAGDASTQPGLPTFEVFTPNGKHVVQRKPLGTWMLWKEGNPKLRRAAAGARPWRSRKGDRKG